MASGALRQLLSAVSLLAVVALVTAMLTIRARADAEWQALVAASGGEQVITFRTRAGEQYRFFFPEWTLEHLEAVAAISGADELFWRGGYQLIQGPASAYVLPLVVASPGFLTARNTALVAGRDLTEEDAGRPRAVLSEAHARIIFPELTPGEVIGRRVQVGDRALEVVGVAAELDAAYQAARQPPLRFAAVRDVDAVYLRVASERKLNAALAPLNAYLAEAGLGGLEAVPYREFVRPGVVTERLAYVREIAGLFGWVVALAVLLAVVNLATQALLTAARERQAWALARMVGASRWQLVALVLARSARREGVAVVLGALAGLALGAQLGGLVTAGSALAGLGVGLGSLAAGSLPLVAAALRLYPYRALRESRALARHKLLGASGALGLFMALALVVVAGGFRDLGQVAIGAELEAIGADLVELVPDRSTILPVARLTPSDAAALAEHYPQLPMTLVERGLAELQVGERAVSAEVLVADGGFMAVSGTRLAAGEPGLGLILGHAVAEQLFPDGEAVGQVVTLSGGRYGRRELAVVGVAAPPTTERLEALQLRPEMIYAPAELLGNLALTARLYLRAGGLGDAALDELAATLSARHPEHAPFVPRYAAATLQSYLARLDEQSRQFNVAAALTLLLAAIGLATLAEARADARRYLRGLERAFGARRRDLFAAELASTLGLALLVGGMGALAGLAAFALWAQAAGYAPVVPQLWLAAALGVALGIGLAVGVGVARQVAARPPIAVLRGEL